MRVTAILASHNRRQRTLACLHSYFDQQVPPDVSLSAVLVDDGSADGTADAVRKLEFDIEIVEESGDLFWAAGMACAEAHAVRSEPDFILWLNDDVVLDAGAVARLLGVAMGVPAGIRIVVGAMRDIAGTRTTYGGLVRSSRIHPMKFALVLPRDVAASVDTFHGNVALVPRAVYSSVGGIDGGFAHAAADFDYGLRATALGFEILLAPGTAGTCDREVGPGPCDWSIVGLVEGIRVALGPKGLSPRSQARFLRRHGGSLWPIFFVIPYCRLIRELMTGSLRDGLPRWRSLRQSTTRAPDEARWIARSDDT